MCGKSVKYPSNDLESVSHLNERGSNFDTGLLCLLGNANKLLSR